MMENLKRRKIFHGDNETEGRTGLLPPGIPASRKVLSREEYTVGWIAALSLEMAAARGMLDEVHDDCGRMEGDNNTYILGRIGRHNCVIACLPAGVYGTTSATAVASGMRFSFPSIQFWLMVGIGGGAPTTRNDIRLGDVAVGTPSPGHPAVIQYDYGKTVANGKLERTGSMNRPPSLLLTAISKLQSEYRVQSSTLILKLVSNMLRRHPEMADSYSSPGPNQDILFETEYEHMKAETTCVQCDNSQVIQRPSRASPSPIVHYGTIASGNQVIKHGKTRDSLAQELDIVCFEMEAAGLTDFSFLAIRGICDYSDSHKNKQWQGYAAATAAAYAKQLLLVISPTNKSNSPPITTARMAERRKIFIDSLRFDQIQARQDTIKAAHTKTCQWLLTHDKYQCWFDSSKLREHHGFLWIKGKPGTGKSTIMKYVFENARQNFRERDEVVISFFFNARGEELERSTAGMYRSLLLQLLLAVPEAQSALDSMCLTSELNNPEHLSWNLIKLQDLLFTAVRGLGQRRTVFCFVDALDECCEDEVRDMIDFFVEVGSLAESTSKSLHICFSSRHYPYISFDKGLEIVLEQQEGHSQDLSKYLNSKLSAIRDKQIAEVKTEILEKASGIFLWVVLVVDILRRAYDQGRMSALRRRLREIPRRLSDLFKDILTRDRDNLQDLFVCLQWVLFSKRPLAPEELYWAIQSHDESELMMTEAPEDGDMAKRFILSSSKGLAEMTRSRTRPTVQFIHESVRDYLLKDGGMRDLFSELQMGPMYKGHGLLKYCCENYIKMCIAKGHLNTTSKLPRAKSAEGIELRKKVVMEFLFLEYAVEYVLQHADESEAEGIRQDAFIDNFKLVDFIHVHNLLEKHETRRYTSTASFMYIFADHDLPNLIKAGLRQGLSMNMAGERYSRPILAALEKGNMRAAEAFLCPKDEYPNHEKDLRALFKLSDCKELKGKPFLAYLTMSSTAYILKLALATGWLDLGVRDKNGESPLHTAIANGRSDMVKVLLDAGAMYSDNDRSMFEPLMCLAIQQDQENVVKMLFDARMANFEKVHFDIRNTSRGSALHTAVIYGRDSIVKMLLRAGAQLSELPLEERDDSGQSILHNTILHGHDHMAQMLIEEMPAKTRQTHLTAEDILGQTPLHIASQKGLTIIVKMLLDSGADPNSATLEGKRALSFAAETGHVEVSKILIQGGAEVDFVDPSGLSPLEEAAKSGHYNVVEILLASGARPKYDESCWNKCLCSVVHARDKQMARFWITHGAQVDCDCFHHAKRTPLLDCAIVTGDTELVQLLISNGADANCGILGLSLTDVMKIYKEPTNILRVLLAYGADANVSDGGRGMTALHLAAHAGNYHAIKIFLDHGGLELDRRDFFGYTALLAACSFGFYPHLRPEHEDETEAIIRLLLENGAEISARNYNGLSALRIIPPSFQRCIALLIAYGCPS